MGDEEAKKVLHLLLSTRGPSLLNHECTQKIKLIVPIVFKS